MATRFILAVAAEREICVVRQCCQHLDGARCIGLRHLGPVALGKACPLRGVAGLPSELHRLDARCQVGIPNVVPVPTGELRLRNATRWSPHRTDSRPFSGRSLAAKPDDSNCQTADQPSLCPLQGRTLLAWAAVMYRWTSAGKSNLWRASLWAASVTAAT